MIIFLIAVNVILTALALWGAFGSYINSASFQDITEVDGHTEAVLYLIALIVAGVSTQFKEVKSIASVCAVIITISGGYVVYGSWHDTAGKAYECFGESGLDQKKQEKCIDQILQSK
ncbi:MAG: hypothetical protein EA373_09240 [Oceanospirillales bacterium]|nr:MAG: hypothetical protein EA373_09240 [Oceanospirillales bacterium]